MDSLTIFCAKYLFIVIPLLWLAVLIQAGNKRRKQIILATFLAVVMAVILDKLFSKLYYDPRPFVTQNINPLIAHAPDNGFPSEHTLFSVTLSTVILFFRRKIGLIGLGISLIVGIARVAAHVHSPIDIAGGAVLGLAAGYIGFWLSQKYFTDRKKSDAAAAGQHIPDEDHQSHD
jgi:undecaprenyl-diphosphatase